MSSSVNKKEIAQFSKDADRWWDESGPFAPLHRLNPERLRYIKDQICAHYDRDVADLSPFTKLSILDIGCGGGLVCEPMARLGAQVTGLDADAVAIDAAKDHAAQSSLTIDYQNRAAEDLNKQFDVVLALEIVEHVNDLDQFIATCAKRLKPGGLIIFSTLNRTPKSFMLGIVAAEYILRWVPQGTHSWKKFVKPSELAKALRKQSLQPKNITGMMFDPLEGEFKLHKTDTDVNYFMSAS